MTDTRPRLLTTSPRRLGCSPGRIRDLIERGKIRAVRYGRSG